MNYFTSQRIIHIRRYKTTKTSRNEGKRKRKQKQKTLKYERKEKGLLNR